MFMRAARAAGNAADNAHTTTKTAVQLAII